MQSHALLVSAYVHKYTLYTTHATDWDQQRNIRICTVRMYIRWLEGVPSVHSTQRGTYMCIYIRTYTHTVCVVCAYISTYIHTYVRMYLCHSDTIHVHVLQRVEEVGVGHHSLGNTPVPLLVPLQDHDALTDTLHLWWGLGKGPDLSYIRLVQVVQSKPSFLQGRQGLG